MSDGADREDGDEGTVGDVDDAIVPIPPSLVDAEDHPDDAPHLGDWVWVNFGPSKYDKTDKGGPALGCVVHVGSNYAKVEGPSTRGTGNWTVRVAIDAFWKTCRPAPDAEAHIGKQIEDRKVRTAHLLGQIKAIVAKLAVAPDRLSLPGGDVQAIVKVSGQQPIEEYKAALVLAKDKTIPEIQQQIKSAQEELAHWMKAPLIATRASIGVYEDAIKLVESRVFHVELYAGLCETVEQVAGGAPAAEGEPIWLMQRRHYMDEECLANYDAGGMRYQDIGQFHAWLARPENRDRILPHPRCVVAFQVRRKEHRGKDEVTFADFIQMAFGGRDWDKTTVLYLRNGDQVGALTTGIDFDEQLFPDFERLDSGQGLWARFFGDGGRVEELITDGEYQEKVAAEKERARKIKLWKKMTSGEKRAWLDANGHGTYKLNWPFLTEMFAGREDHFSSSDRYKPYRPDSLYYDDIHKHVTAEMLRHNRLVLVLQGILDRSRVFHPHPAISLATHDGFQRAIRLVYDDARALTDGEKPDFEAFRAELNASIQVGTVTVGQEEAWLIREAERENKRPRSGSFRDRTEYKRFRPYGDPGPGKLSRIAEWSPRARKATYRWSVEKEDWRRRSRGVKPKTIAVPAAQLLNADAYPPSAYKRFFNDPRTRADYVQWAPLLLAAEDYKAGKRKVGESDEE